MTHLGSLASLSSLPIGVLIVLGVVSVVEVVLIVIALVDLYRRPVAQVAFGIKWVWVLIIVLINLLGAILYLIIGRQPAPPTEQPASTATPERRASIADDLYGDDTAPR
jgi:hypothetical protein